MFIGEDPIHIKTDSRSDISELVIMPGDPLRAKYIAENFLEDAKLVTSVRNMLGYTGMYKGKKVTVMGSGMGMPSMGIYSFELFHFYNVRRIIRIGTCGVVSPDVKIPEIILGNLFYSDCNYAYSFDDYPKNTIECNEGLNRLIKQTSKELNLQIHEGAIMTTDVFGPYVGPDRLLQRVPSYINLLGEEMEGFALMHTANHFTREAAVIVTAVDSKYSNEVISIEDREKSLDNMINLALNSIIK